MSVADRVGENVNPIQAQAMTIPITCHLATITWLYREIHAGGDPPTLQLAANWAAVINDIADNGSVRGAPYKGTLAVSKGSVIVFRPQGGGAPSHSCIAKSDTTIGGYNQTDWFRSPGVESGYSEHPLTDFRWGKGAHADEVIGKTGYYQLVTTIEPVAKKSLGIL